MPVRSTGSRYVARLPTDFLGRREYVSQILLNAIVKLFAI
jgi:hypothetical protein